MIRMLHGIGVVFLRPCILDLGVFYTEFGSVESREVYSMVSG